MESVPDHILVRCRWVLCNKGDTVKPDVRARLVATEINKDGPIAHFAASTPPLEGKKALFAKFVSHRRTGKDALRISFVDIRKAYFNAIPERAIFMKLPPEMGMGPDAVARQVRCVYGTRDAGRLRFCSTWVSKPASATRACSITLAVISASWYTATTSPPWARTRI